MTHGIKKIKPLPKRNSDSIKESKRYVKAQNTEESVSALTWMHKETLEERKKITADKNRVLMEEF